MKELRKSFGPFHLKNKPGKHGHIVSNPVGKYLVVKEIIIEKLEGNNRVLLTVVMPDPEDIEVLEKQEKNEQSVDFPGQ